MVRELANPGRYDLCKPIAAAMGLDTRSDSTLWKDKAVHLLSEASPTAAFACFFLHTPPFLHPIKPAASFT